MVLHEQLPSPLPRGSETLSAPLSCTRRTRARLVQGVNESERAEGEVESGRAAVQLPPQVHDEDPQRSLPTSTFYIPRASRVTPFVFCLSEQLSRTPQPGRVLRLDIEELKQQSQDGETHGKDDQGQEVSDRSRANPNGEPVVRRSL